MSRFKITLNYSIIDANRCLIDHSNPMSLQFLRQRSKHALDRFKVRDLGLTEDRIAALCEAGHVSLEEEEGTP